VVAELPTLLRVMAVVFVSVPALFVIAYAPPRALGRRWARTVVRRTIPGLRRLATVLSPLRQGAPQSRTDGGSDDEMDEAAAEGEADELTALAGVLAFTERPIREVMTPRTDIVAVQEGVSVEEVGRLFTESGYSRLPVYRDSLDDLVGMIYAFDLLKTEPGAELPIRTIATAPTFKRSAELLYEMQRDRRQIAVVLDEYGGTAGLVTFEDLLEELVGEIFDEHDGLARHSAPPIQLVEADAATTVEEIEATFGLTLPEGAQTLGGLLTLLAGQIPSAGERFRLAGLEFDVIAATPSKLERILIRRGQAPIMSLDREDAP
jgi:CBS domain containing-hemolysin-like protein